MDADIKQSWVDALRSGKYRQGQGDLRKEGAYCCLGVLCDVMGAKWSKSDAYIDNELQSFYLSKNALAQVGLTDAQQEPLWRMNDEGKSFTEIATYIEVNIPSDGSAVCSHEGKSL